MVGWYHTGPRLRSSDVQINDVIKRYVPRPVMTIVDVRSDIERGQGDIPTDAYFAVEEIKDVSTLCVDRAPRLTSLRVNKDGSTTQKTFVHVPSVIEAEEAEEIGVEHLLRDIQNLSVGTLSSRVAGQLSSLRGLEHRLVEICDYLQAVSRGELPVNQQLAYHLQDIFNLLPNLEAAEYANQDKRASSRPFTVATNDQLLVVYISSLVRAVIALHELVRLLRLTMPLQKLT